jgi:tetratricopeptide (TPR) repeat protein
MKKYPENVNIPLAIATVYYNAEMPQAREFLLRAAEIEPKNGKIWDMLAGDASTRGQYDLAKEYSEKAALNDPSNADYAFSYLWLFRNSKPEDYKQKVFEFVKRFPDNEVGAEALYWLGVDATDRNDRINYFEELQKQYPPQKFRWSAAGMEHLADEYMQSDPEKALVLINEMGNENDWPLRKQIAESLTRVNKLEKDQNYSQAIAEIDSIKLPKYHSFNNFTLLKKASLLDKAGNTQSAYDSLAAKFTELPTDQLDTTLELYGNKIGKDKAQVDKDIETIRNSTAVAAYPFHLGLYTSKDSLSLKSLKGKVT